LEIDEINLAIINHLKDGRVSYKKIADDLHLAEGTVRTRVRKLREEGVLEITGLVDPEAMPEKKVVMVGIKLKNLVNSVVSRQFVSSPVDLISCSWLC